MQLPNFLIAVVWALTIFLTPVFLQSTPGVRPKVKNFGKSLKRPAGNSSAEKKTEKKENRSEEDVIRIDTNLVILDCLVVDNKGNIVTGLKAEDFIISEDNQPQQIETFSLGDDAKVPRSVVLIIDYSASQKPYIERSVEAAKLLVDKLRPNDLMAIATDDVELIAQFTADKKKLKKELDSLKKKRGFLSYNIGASKQFSSLYAVLNEVFDETDVRPIVIFQTDGDELLFLKDQFGDLIYPQMAERKTGFSTGDLLNFTAKSRASIYSIFVGAKLLGLSPAEKRRKQELERLRWHHYWEINPQLTPEEEDLLRQQKARAERLYPQGVPDAQEFMFELSRQTGGWLEFLEEPEQADGIYNRILAELNTRYIIGYLPTNERKDGKRRAVRIEVKNHPEYKILGKTSYVAGSLN